MPNESDFDGIFDVSSVRNFYEGSEFKYICWDLNDGAKYQSNHLVVAGSSPLRIVETQSVL
ncbi:hypothetical protein PIROE2DRAFT_12506 [Piromyces sp. E2]|nr:hypothetical protein PIROE2DRAFT_12506 [Piromyces sp. E2]|eukprot:OUM61504.1 hypothetical protein PIROE2DRAFT_12506 [Piromyces sp. E2]